MLDDATPAHARAGDEDRLLSRQGDVITATRMDILARRRTFEFGVADIKREPTTLRPFVTFEAAGESFFVTKSGFLEEADADLFGSNS